MFPLLNFIFMADVLKYRKQNHNRLINVPVTAEIGLLRNVLVLSLEKKNNRTTDILLFVPYRNCRSWTNFFYCSCKYWTFFQSPDFASGAASRIFAIERNTNINWNSNIFLSIMDHHHIQEYSKTDKFRHQSGNKQSLRRSRQSYYISEPTLLLFFLKEIATMQ